MYSGNFVFSQIMDHLPWPAFHQCVAHYNGDKYIKTFNCSEQYRCMDFAQLTYKSSLRDIEICLRSQASKLYHMGIRKGISRNNLANANQFRDWIIYAEFSQNLCHIARSFHVDDALSGIDIDDSIYVLDSTTIDLCLSLFPWAQFRKNKGDIKMHTLLDLHGNIPTLIHIFDGKLHDVNILDFLPLEAGAFFIMDRVYLDFERLHRMNLCGIFFVLGAKSNAKLRSLRSNQADPSISLICDQAVKSNDVNSKTQYPESFRRVEFYDAETGKELVFLTNNFALPPESIATLYKSRWQIELFFKWVKQHLRINSFFGTSENAVKCQIWIAVSVYVHIAIIRKRLHIKKKFAHNSTDFEPYHV